MIKKPLANAPALQFLSVVIPARDEQAVSRPPLSICTSNCLSTRYRTRSL